MPMIELFLFVFRSNGDINGVALITYLVLFALFIVTPIMEWKNGR